MRTVGALVTGLIAATLLLGGCKTSATEVQVVDLAPASTAVLGSVRIEQALSDPDVRAIVDRIAAGGAGSSSMGNDPIAGAKEHLGVDLSRTREIVFALPGESLDQAEGRWLGKQDGRDFRGVLFFSGQYDRQQVAGALERKAQGPLARSSYKGHELLSAAVHDSSAPATVLFLEPEVLVVGDEPSVKAVIDVRKGDAPGVSLAIAGGYKDLGAPLMKVYAKVPERGSASPSPSPRAPLSLDPSLVSTVSAATLTIDKASDGARAVLTLAYRDSASAQRAQDALGGIVSLLRGFSPDAALTAALKNIEVKGDGASRVTITASMNAEQVQALMALLAAR